MCEGCCSKEKHGNLLLCGQACSCILSNAHACNEWCRSADLLLERLGSVANVVWWKWCFLLWLVVAGTLVSAELWISILAADLHHRSSSACFLAQVQVLCFSAGTSSCLVCSHLGGSCCRGFSTGMQQELDFLYFLGKKLYFLEVHCFFMTKRILTRWLRSEVVWMQKEILPLLNRGARLFTLTKGQYMQALNLLCSFPSVSNPF